jgi:hypothetical protein
MAKAGELFSAQSRRVIIRLVLEYRLIPTSICHACCSGADHVPQANPPAGAGLSQIGIGYRASDPRSAAATVGPWAPRS